MPWARPNSPFQESYYIGIILRLYWGYVGVILGIMEDIMETTIWDLRLGSMITG